MKTKINAHWILTIIWGLLWAGLTYIVLVLISCNDANIGPSKVEILNAKMKHENDEMTRFNDSARKYSTIAEIYTSMNDPKTSNRYLKLSNAFLDSSRKHQIIFWEHYYER